MNLRIKEILKQRNISIKDFADMLGVHRVNLSNQINTGNPTLKTLQQWADALGVDASDLLDRRKMTVACPHCSGEITIKIEQPDL